MPLGRTARLVHWRADPRLIHHLQLNRAANRGKTAERGPKWLALC
ncbi:hypothetical protein [Pseudooceanicola sp.]|nr:hypothetical protein [Pseudooceanicola sp.]MDF1855080.1 hypothetical protein [Pseudooceanicola sp.]